ncbi:MAG: copper resistance CopC family protein, partial [Anaerolineales bacterium]
MLAPSASPALAHASLVSADPAPGVTVPATFAEISLTFDEALIPGSTFTLFTNSFQKLEGISPRVEGVMLRAALPAPLAPSTYTVQWKAVTGDGHSVEGSYQFGVSEAAR